MAPVARLSSSVELAVPSASYFFPIIDLPNRLPIITELRFGVKSVRAFLTLREKVWEAVWSVA